MHPQRAAGPASLSRRGVSLRPCRWKLSDHDSESLNVGSPHSSWNNLTQRVWLALLPLLAFSSRIDTFSLDTNCEAGETHYFPFRPGCCAKHGLAEGYKTSIDFPDETLSFIKSHPLMDSAVPPIADEPWFTKTRIR